MSDTKEISIDLAAYVKGLRDDAESRALHGDSWVAGRLLGAARIIAGLMPPPEPPKEP
jgi:hypothetical protein